MKLHFILLLSLLAAPALAQRVTGDPGPDSTVDNPDIILQDFRPTCEVDEDCLSGVCENGPNDDLVQDLPGIFYCGAPAEGCDELAPARFDGICNNVQPDQELFGSREHLQLRRIPGRFALTEQLDGGQNINDPNLELERPRTISDFVSNQISSIPNPFGASTLLVYMGQFIDHDLTLIEFEPERDELSGTDPLAVRFEIELSVHVEDSDPVLNPNALTAWIDLSQVYGSDPETAEALRDPNEPAKLRVTQRAGVEFLPRADIINQDDILVETAMSPLLPGLFAAGDIRTNEQVMLSSFHTLFMRNHNFLVEEGLPDLLGNDFTSLTPEEQFQDARRVNIAQFQKIVFDEYFPQWHGELNELPPYEGYNSSLSPDIDIFFSTVTYRFGHTGIVDYVARKQESGADESIFLGNAFFNPNVVTQSGGIDSLLNGARTQCHERVDVQVVNGLRNFLFGNIPGSNLENMDLLSFNLARGRDHEVPTYNSAREFFGLEPADSFEDIVGPNNPCLAELLEEVFEDVVNCDPFICGLAEPATRGEMGELFFASQNDQFRRARDADRFYYENISDEPGETGPTMFSLDGGIFGLDGRLVSFIADTTMRTVLDANTFIGDLDDQNPAAFQTDACCKTVDDRQSSICVRQRARNFRRFEVVDFDRCEEEEQLENLNFFHGTMNPLSLRTYSCTCRVMEDTQQTVQFRIIRQNRPAGESNAQFINALRDEMNLVTTEQQRGPNDDRFPLGEFSDVTEMGDGEVEVYLNVMATGQPEDYYAAEELIGEMEYRLSQNALGPEAIMSIGNMEINCMDCSPLPLAAGGADGGAGGSLLGLSTAAGAGVIAAIVVAALIIVGCGVRFVMKRNQPVTYTSGQESV